MTLIKSRRPKVRILFGKQIRVAPPSDGNILYEDVRVENAIQEHGFGPEASKAAKKNSHRIVEQLLAI